MVVSVTCDCHKHACRLGSDSVVWHPVVHVSTLACVPWLDVEGEADVDVQRLGDVYRRVVTGDAPNKGIPTECAAFTDNPTEIADLTGVPTDFIVSSPSFFPVLWLSGANS